MGADRRAVEVFDQLRAVPDPHPLRGLCDVYSYTAMVSMCIYQQDVDRALELVEDMRWGRVWLSARPYLSLDDSYMLP